MKRITYLIETLLLSIIILIFKVMMPIMASNVGAWLGRKIGPKTGASKTALRNLKLAFPDKSDTEREGILLDMWDNLGRVIGEYPHLRVFTDGHCEIVNVEILEEIAEKEQPCLFIGMHQANWEVAAMKLRSFPGLNVGAVYRAPNNPFVEDLLDRLRDYGKDERHFAKSTQGVREMIGHLKDNGQIGLLIDQKYNEGVQARFMGRPAMTSTAFLELSKKFDCPIIPVQMERVNECYFKMTVHPALDLDLSEPEMALQKTHELIEGWLKDKPAEWLWVHKRWIESKVKK